MRRLVSRKDTEDFVPWVEQADGTVAFRPSVRRRDNKKQYYREYRAYRKHIDPPKPPKPPGSFVASVRQSENRAQYDREWRAWQKANNPEWTAKRNAWQRKHWAEQPEEWREKQREYNRKYAKQHYQERSAFIAEAKSSGCLLCGEMYAPALDFHHVYGKDFQISQTWASSLDRLREEISKCVVLCANCHRKEHHPPEG